MNAQHLNKPQAQLNESPIPTKKPAEVTPKHTKSNEEYHEELVVQPLASGFVNTYFQFTTRWHYGKKDNCEYFTALFGK